LMGRVHNALRSIDFGAIVQGRDRRKAISEAFQSFADAGKRLEGLKLAQERRAKELLAHQRQAEREAVAPVRSEYKKSLHENRRVFAHERNDLALTQAMDTARIRAGWKSHHRNRAKAWENVASSDCKAVTANMARVDEAKKRLEALRHRQQGRDVTKDRERGE
ncbi:MAG: hypothetical protein HOO98_16195, partial [Nitrospira sp.]|nr:hypothetical protein [Nitrospira sp.]